MVRSSKYDTLLDAAEIVVRRDGSGRLTLDAVAAEADVSKGGLLYHFPSKEALLTAMVERMVTSFDEALDQAQAVDTSPPGACCNAQNIFDPLIGRFVRFPAFSGSE